LPYQKESGWQPELCDPLHLERKEAYPSDALGTADTLPSVKQVKIVPALSRSGESAIIAGARRASIMHCGADTGVLAQHLTPRHDIAKSRQSLSIQPRLTALVFICAAERQTEPRAGRAGAHGAKTNFVSCSGESGRINGRDIFTQIRALINRSSRANAQGRATRTLEAVRIAVRIAVFVAVFVAVF
jgi:hypothetical protein